MVRDDSEKKNESNSRPAGAKRRLTPYGQETKKAKRFWNRTRVIAFMAVLITFGVIGLLIFLRPKTSAIEKRELAKFPKMTAASLWDGSFFDDLSTWYTDTYPLHDRMVSAEASLEDKYGIRTAAIYGSRSTATEQVTEDVPATSSTSEAPVLSNSAAEAVSSDSEEESGDGSGTITTEPEMAGEVYVADGCGFGLYYFVQEPVEYFASMINTVSQNVGSAADVYTMIIPTSFGVMLSEDVQKSMNCGLQGEAIDYIDSRLSDSVKQVNIYRTLRSHNGEYIYFHTDHHWTALGAYYAYRQFCRTKGITPHELSDYEKKEFPGFLGSFYAASNQASELKNNPDTVEAYVPISTNEETMTTAKGQTYENMPIIADATDYAADSKYLCFIQGDQPFIEIDNPDINDDSACIVIKESFGNAFVPFLVDHYDKVYVVDYRYYTGNLTELAESHESCDILFAICTPYTGYTERADEMLSLFPAGSSTAAAGTSSKSDDTTGAADES